MWQIIRVLFSSAFSLVYLWAASSHLDSGLTPGTFMTNSAIANMKQAEGKHFCTVDLSQPRQPFHCDHVKKLKLLHVIRDRHGLFFLINLVNGSSKSRNLHE